MKEPNFVNLTEYDDIPEKFPFNEEFNSTQVTEKEFHEEKVESNSDTKQRGFDVKEAV